MLCADKLKEIRRQRKVSDGQLAEHIVRAGLKKKEALGAVRNWQKGLLKPKPRREDIRRLASALSVEEHDLTHWLSKGRYTPMSASKVRLVTKLIAGRTVQDALDTLKFTNKRAASFIVKVLKAAVADADEQQADVDKLYVSEARVDCAGIRLGTKRWIPKDRGRAHPIGKKACHIHVAVRQA